MIAFLRNKIDLILKNYHWEDVNYDLWIAREITSGHLNSNLVFLIAQKYKLSPHFVGQKLIKAFSRIGAFQKVTLEKTFLVFLLKTEIFNDIINQVLEAKSDFGKIDLGKGKRVIYEWVSANPTGYLHFGHARNIFIGQVIVNLLKFVNYDVTREFYINDHGNQVFQLGKTIFYFYQKWLQVDVQPFENMYKNPEVEALGKLAFEKFNTSYKEANFDQNPALQKIFINFGTDFFLNAMKTDLKKWGVEFDSWFSEKTLYQNNYYEQFLARLKKRNITYFKDNALWFDSSKTSYEQDFVLVKSSGAPTYFLGDIMYHDNKMVRKFDLLIDLFGADHHSHFLKIVAGLEGLGWNPKKAAVDLLQMVKIVQSNQELKISKRKGTTISLQKLIKENGLNFLKFLLMSKKRETALLFDFAKLKDSSNLVPFHYIHYAYVRCCQLLKSTTFSQYHHIRYNLLTEKAEQNLILLLHLFPFLIKKTASLREPQILVDFLLRVSKVFHIFYQNVKILHSSSPLKAQRLDLVRAVYQLLSNIFAILGFNFSQKLLSLSSHLKL